MRRCLASVTFPAQRYSEVRRKGGGARRLRRGNFDVSGLELAGCLALHPAMEVALGREWRRRALRRCHVAGCAVLRLGLERRSAEHDCTVGIEDVREGMARQLEVVFDTGGAVVELPRR